MTEPFEWDPTLFTGTASHYRRGRLPYSPEMPKVVRDVLDLDGRGRLLDVGTGPGTVAIPLAPLFEEVVGVDPDADMLWEAAKWAKSQGLVNVSWKRMRAEELPDDLGMFRVAAFAQSFHWTRREAVAKTILKMLEPSGAFLHVNQEPPAAKQEPPTSQPQLPSPPIEAIGQLVARYLGPMRRAGQSTLPRGTPSGEAAIIERAGFQKEEVRRIPGGQPLERPAEDVVAWVFSRSNSAPHLFGTQLNAFKSDLTALLKNISPTGQFLDFEPDTVLRIWRKPSA